MPYAAVFTSAEGLKQTFPLDWLYAHGALVANKVGGEHISESFGGVNQLWMTGAAARLFVRDIVSIDFVKIDEPVAPPSFEADRMLFQNRPNASVNEAAEANTAGDDEALSRKAVNPGFTKSRATHRIGKEVAFEGYAYDFDRRIDAVEFSLDQGETWTAYPTPETTSERWVWWNFSFTPELPGPYELWVRAISEGNHIGQVAAKCPFSVE